MYPVVFECYCSTRSFPSQSTSRRCPTARALAVCITHKQTQLLLLLLLLLLLGAGVACTLDVPLATSPLSLVFSATSHTLSALSRLSAKSCRCCYRPCDSSTSYEAAGGAGEGMWNSPSFLRRSRSWRFFDRSGRALHRIESLECLF